MQYFFIFSNHDPRTRPASDPAQNPYWKRDVRRAYPQLSVVTQSELSTLLIQHSGAAAAESVKLLLHIHPPHPRFRFHSVAVRFYSSRLFIHPSIHPHRIAAPLGTDATSVTAQQQQQQQLNLTEAIGAISTARKTYSASSLPPTPPTPFKRWIPERAPDAPHDPNAYFPMILVK